MQTMLRLETAAVHCVTLCCCCRPVAPLQNGAPKVAVFHGLKDQLFPINKTARPIVQQVAQRLPSSEISYQEHQGAHEAPPAVVQQGLEWFLTDKPISPTKFSRKGRPAPATAAERGSRLGM
jgi:predicted esterase